MPYLPGGGAQQVSLLRTVLEAVVEADGLTTAPFEAVGAQRTLREAVKPLSSAGFVQPVDRTHAAITAEAAMWLTTNDDSQLLGVLHRHVRFVGELLASLDGQSKTMREIQSIAAQDFDLLWATLDQARRRVTWLMCLGAVEYKTNTVVGITERGRELLGHLVLGGPEIAAPVRTSAVQVPDPPRPIQDLLGQLTPETLATRYAKLGYIPRGNGESDAVDALRALVNAASPSASKVELLAFAEQHFGVKESSFAGALSMLTRSGLLEQTSLGVYSPTAPGQAWLETENPLDLVLLLHTRYLFVLEIISLLHEQDQAPGLARAASEYFQLPRADVGAVRTRLQLLRSAGLIAERANFRYQPTPLGEEVARRYVLQGLHDEFETARPDPESDDPPGEYHTQAMRISRDLRKAGVESDSPRLLEQATASALEFLGFDARHIGGSGSTDVLAILELEDSQSVRVILDAKSSRSGVVNEGAVSFDTLREHKARHEADYVVLVGPGFDSGRVRSRAQENMVALITTNELADIVIRHATTPLSSHHYIDLVRSDEVGRINLESTWASAEQRGTILAQVVDILADEAGDSDDVTQGALTSNEIYLIARSDRAGARPRPQTIESTLQLLQHPFLNSIKSVAGERGRPVSYRLVDRPALIQSKLQALARAMDGIEQD